MMSVFKNKFAGGLLALTCLASVAAPALADDKPSEWTDTIKFSLQIEGGVMFNTASPRNGGNFGHLYTDRANTAFLNQALVGVARPLDPKATGYDFGFKLQGMYGSDGRYTRWYNFGTGQNSRTQFDLVEANLLLHAPWLTEGGIDFKAGLFVTPFCAEAIDPSSNIFYSHSYIFNFGVPTKHTGVLATLHATDIIDVYAGVTSGVNTLLGPYNGDNNSSYSFLAGLGLNLLEGNLTILGLLHFGPENTGKALAPGGGFVSPANRSNRYYADLLVTYKATEALTFITEVSYVHDEFNFGGGVNAPTAYGIAQYVTYAISDSVTLGARAEIFRDDKNFYVAYFPGNNDFNNIFSGRPGNAIFAPGTGTTYGALTLGLTYKPSLEKIGTPGSLAIRPELRYDTALSSNKPYNGGKDKGQFTVGADFILSF